MKETKFALVFWTINDTDPKRDNRAKKDSHYTGSRRTTHWMNLCVHASSKRQIVLTRQSLSFSTRNAVIACLAISLG